MLRIVWWLVWCMLVLAATATAEEIRLAYVGDREGSVWRGVTQGLHEANVLGRFTGDTYTVQSMSPEALAATSSTQLPVAVLAAADLPTLQRLATTLAAGSVAILNMTLDADQLREKCQANVLHIIPSAGMKADAVAQWHHKHAGAPVEARAWQADFTKFAARELNNRFRKAHGVAMDDAAWAGWAAVKILADAVARTQQTTPASVLAYLRTDLAFDGQKGLPLTFRKSGQLRQPLLLVEGGKLVGEAPVRGVADPTDLDSLGNLTCQQ